MRIAVGMFFWVPTLLFFSIGGVLAEEPKRLPGGIALPCETIFGDPSPGSEPAKIYHMLIFYKAGGPVCFGPAGKDFAKNPEKMFADIGVSQFIIQTVRGAPVGKAFIVVVGVQHADPKTEKTYLVPSILTMVKTEEGDLQGFKVIESRRLERGRFVRSMTENDVVNLVAAQEFVIFGRAERGAASENVNPKFFEMMIDPYIAYLVGTANLECSEEHTT